jgi:hypothetical protein
VIQLDVLPCTVELPGGRVWEICRILVDTRGHAGVWALHGARAVNIWSGQTTATESLAPRGTPRAAGPWRLETAGGTVVTATKTGGCQCALGNLPSLGEPDLIALDVAE